MMVPLVLAVLAVGAPAPAEQQQPLVCQPLPACHRSAPESEAWTVAVTYRLPSSRRGYRYETALGGGLSGRREEAECQAEVILREGLWIDEPERSLVAPGAIELLTVRQILE